MNEIEELKREAMKLAFNSVYQDADNIYFREILLRRMISLEIENRRNEKIDEILKEE